MTIKILSKGIMPFKIIYHASCMDCWSTFTYEQDDMNKSAIEFGKPNGYKIIKCPVCFARIHITTPIPYVNQT